MNKAFRPALAFLFVLAGLAFLPGASQGREEAAEAISAFELRQAQLSGEGVVVLDARARKDFETARIEGAALPLSEGTYRRRELYRQKAIPTPPDIDKALERRMRGYPRNTFIVTYCEPDCESGIVLMQKLKKLGFTNVKVMSEGFKGWQDRGYPVARGIEGISPKS